MPEPTSIVPDKGIRPGVNQNTADIAKGTFVVLAPGAGDLPNSIDPAGNGARVYGVTMEVIIGTTAATALGLGAQRGNIQTEGKALVIAAGATTRGGPIGSDASGQAVNAATGDIVAGVGVTVGVATEFLEIELAGPGGGAITA
jgi:hypothetical protein